MNNFKNAVILALSVIILLQSAFLVYFMHRARSAEKIERVAPRPRVSPQATPEPGARPEVQVPPVSVPAERPRPPVKTVGRIVLVLDDWGNSLKNRSFITDNDFHVTLAILPREPYAETVARLASQKGREVLVHMPMEPHNKEQYRLEDDTILLGMDKRKVFALLQEAFRLVPQAKGLNNHMGSLATEDQRLMRMVMEYLKKNHKIFLDSCTTQRSVGSAVARQYGVPSAARDVFIDNDEDPTHIRQQLLKLAARAKQNGLAFGIGHDRVPTVAVLQEMIPLLQDEGYEFIYISEAVGY